MHAADDTEQLLLLVTQSNSALKGWSCGKYWAEGMLGDVFQAPARSNYSGLAGTAHARGARPLPCPFPPEPQHDVLSTPLTSPSRVGEAKSSRRTHHL